MFQKSRPELSNRFQSFSSRTSTCRAFKASVTLRVPASKFGNTSSAAAVLQQAQSGSHPCALFGTAASASLFIARRTRKLSQSAVSIGISQLTIKFHESFSPPFFASSNAVRIPPSGPSPGQRSGIVSTAPALSFTVGETTFTEGTTVASKLTVRRNIVCPCSSASALSVPNRELAPPARTYPRTNSSPALMLRPPLALSPAAGYPARAIFPANFAGANQSSPPCAKHSSDDSPTAS